MEFLSNVRNQLVNILIKIFSLGILFVTTMKTVAKHSFRVGQCVYAKMKFYPPWPAIIQEIRNNQARVQFFGWFNQWFVVINS